MLNLDKYHPRINPQRRTEDLIREAGFGMYVSKRMRPERLAKCCGGSGVWQDWGFIPERYGLVLSWVWREVQWRR